MKGNQASVWRYLLQHADHAGVLAHGQSQGHGQSLLVLKAAGVELGPELHLQLPIFLLRKLKLRHAALQLQEDRQGDRQGGLKSALLSLLNCLFAEIRIRYLSLDSDRHLLLQSFPGPVGKPLGGSAEDLKHTSVNFQSSF